MKPAPSARDLPAEHPRRPRRPAPAPWPPPRRSAPAAREAARLPRRGDSGALGTVAAPASPHALGDLGWPGSQSVPGRSARLIRGERIRPRPRLQDGEAGLALRGGARRSSGQRRGWQDGRRGAPPLCCAFPARGSPPLAAAGRRGSLRPASPPPPPRAPAPCSPRARSLGATSLRLAHSLSRRFAWERVNIPGLGFQLASNLRRRPACLPAREAPRPPPLRAP